MINSLTADGVELDQFAQSIGVGSNRWSVPGAKGENLSIPARHGSLYVPDKTFTEGEFTLEINVSGYSDDGSVPPDQLSQTRYNIDRLLAIFTKRKKLIRFAQRTDNGPEIECYAECVGAFDVTRTSAAIPYAKMTVAFKIPRAFWQDSSVTEYTTPTGLVTGQSLRLPPFEGGTAPMDDLVYLVYGPIASPELKVMETGAYTRLENTVPAGSVWRIDAANWTSVMGTGVTFDSTNNPSAISKTVHGGSATFMDLPPLFPFEPAIQINGGNMGSTTKVAIRGRRKFLVS